MLTRSHNEDRGNAEMSLQYYKQRDSNKILSGIALMPKKVTFKRRGIFEPSDDKLNSRTADVTLMADNRKLNAHRHVLASNSVYFERMFGGSFKEKSQNNVKINMVSFNFKTLKTLINCFYTTKLTITKLNAQDLLIGSNLFLCDDVQQACVDYLKIMIDSENCMSIKDLANSLCLNELYSLCLNYIINHFRFVCKHEDFMLSTFEEIMMYVKDDNLFATEDMVYDVVMNWIKYNIKDRYCYCTIILWFIRLPLIFNTYQGIVNVKDYGITKIKNVNSFRMEHRKPFRKGILLISHNPHISTPEWFNVTANQWQFCSARDCDCANFKIILRPPIYLATCVLLNNGTLIAVGGIIHDIAVNCVQMFEPEFGIWSNMPSMNFQRIKPYVIQIGSKVFAVGGCNKLSYENIMEYLDLDEQVWFSVNIGIKKPPKILGEYIYVSCVNQLIYIIGIQQSGFFNPLTNIWNYITPIPILKFGSAICVLNNNIYVIGGEKNGIFYKSVLAYCTQTKVWVSVAALNFPRSHPGVAVINGNIYVFGGKIDDTNISNTFEIYDYHTNTWTVSRALMNLSRSVIDAIVLEKKCFFYQKVFDDATNLIFEDESL